MRLFIGAFYKATEVDLGSHICIGRMYMRSHIENWMPAESESESGS